MYWYIDDTDITKKKVKNAIANDTDIKSEIRNVIIQGLDCVEDLAKDGSDNDSGGRGLWIFMIILCIFICIGCAAWIRYSYQHRHKVIETIDIGKMNEEKTENVSMNKKPSTVEEEIEKD